MYLERYLAGECEQVWDELIVLGDAVREEPIYSDAKAVARETMQRVRRNIETLYQRLQSIGYQFEIERPRPQQNPLSDVLGQLTDDPLLKSMFGNLSINLDTVQDQLQGLFGGQAASNAPAMQWYAYMPPEDDIIERLDEFEKEIGILPISLRAWCEVVGMVDFTGDYPGLASYHREKTATSGDFFDIRGMVRQMLANNPHLITAYENDNEEAIRRYFDEQMDSLPFDKSAMMDMYGIIKQEMEAMKANPQAAKEASAETWWVSDPLVVTVEIDAEEANWELEDQREYGEGEPEDDTYVLLIAPDEMHKANISGSTYDVIVPNDNMDAPLEGTGLHFVAYLRNSFAWGGFPGLASENGYDEKTIAFLKEGLEPI